MSNRAQIFAVHKKRQGVKEKYPGFKHKGYSDFSLNPLEAFQGCHFSAVRGPVSGATGSHNGHPSVKPSLLPSLINKGQLGARRRQCAPSGAWRSPPTAHTYPAARDTSVRPPGTSSPGAGQKSQVRRVTAHVDRSAAVRPPDSAPSNGPRNSNSSTSVCDPEPTAAPPLPGKVEGGRLRLRLGFPGGEVRAFCAGAAARTRPGKQLPVLHVRGGVPSAPVTPRQATC